MSNRHKAAMGRTAITAIIDQEIAAGRQTRGNAMHALGRTETDGMLRKGTPLDLRVKAAISTAWATGRVCPHVVGGPRPSTLDVWRAIIGCGDCFLPEQFEPLPGNAEFECDLCAGPIKADTMTHLLIQTGSVMAGLALCPGCLVIVRSSHMRPEAGS